MKRRYSTLASGVLLSLAIGLPVQTLAAGYGSETKQSGAETSAGRSGTESEYSGKESGMGKHGDTGQAGESMSSLSVDQLEGRTIVNQTGDEIGEIQQIVRDKTDDRVHAVVSAGGFLGIGDKMVTLPLDELRMEGEQLHTPLASTESGLKSRSAYDAAGFERIQGSQMVQIGGAVSMGEKAGSMAMGEHEPSAESTGFRTLDTNRDGYLSKEEANRSGLISGHWQQADTNDDGRLDRSEFSAFEAQESPGEGSMRMSPGKGAQGGEGMKESMQESMQESGGKY